MSQDKIEAQISATDHAGTETQGSALARLAQVIDSGLPKGQEVSYIELTPEHIALIREVGQAEVLRLNTTYRLRGFIIAPLEISGKFANILCIEKAQSLGQFVEIQIAAFVMQLKSLGFDTFGVHLAVNAEIAVWTNLDVVSEPETEPKPETGPV